MGGTHVGEWLQPAVALGSVSRCEQPAGWHLVSPPGAGTTSEVRPPRPGEGVASTPRMPGSRHRPGARRSALPPPPVPGVLVRPAARWCRATWHKVKVHFLLVFILATRLRDDSDGDPGCVRSDRCVVLPWGTGRRPAVPRGRSTLCSRVGLPREAQTGHRLEEFGPLHVSANLPPGIPPLLPSGPHTHSAWFV